MKKHIVTVVMTKNGISFEETYRIRSFVNSKKAMLAILDKYNSRDFNYDCDHIKWLTAIVYDKRVNKTQFDNHFIGNIHTTFDKIKVNHKILMVDRVRLYA